MGAGAATAGSGGMGGQALETKRVSPRISAGDIVVYVGAVLLVLLGWGLKTLHDDRTTEIEVGGVTVAYPDGWIRLPTTEPLLLRAVSNENGRERLLLSAQETTQTDIRLALASGAANPSSGETAYTQLGNRSGEVDGNPAVETDYAYVATTVGGATAPTVIQGRQAAWIKDGRLLVLAFEAPEQNWDEDDDDFDRLVDEVST